MSKKIDKPAAGLVLVILAILVFGSAWVVMLLLGALAHIFKVEELSISFWGAFVVNLALSVVGSYFKSNSK